MTAFVFILVGRDDAAGIALGGQFAGTDTEALLHGQIGLDVARLEVRRFGWGCGFVSHVGLLLVHRNNRDRGARFRRTIPMNDPATCA